MSEIQSVTIQISKGELVDKFNTFMRSRYPERNDDDDQKEMYYTRIGLFYEFAGDLFDGSIKEPT